MEKKNAFGMVAALVVLLLGAGFFLIMPNMTTSTSSSTPSKSTVLFYVTDPAAYSSNVTLIQVNISSVYVHMIPSNVNASRGWVKLTGSTVSIDLIQTIGKSTHISDYQIPSGQFDSLKLVLASSKAKINGTLKTLTAGNSTFAPSFPAPIYLVPQAITSVTLDMSLSNAAMMKGQFLPTFVLLSSQSPVPASIISPPSVSPATSFTSSSSSSAKICAWFEPFC